MNEGEILKFSFKKLIENYPLEFIALIVSMLFCSVTFFLNWKIALGELTVIVLLFVSGILKRHDNFKNIKKAVSEFNDSLSFEEKGNVQSLPLPLLIADSDNKILWYNTLFQDEVVSKNSPFSSEIMPFTDNREIADIRNANSFNATIYDKKYTVFQSPVEYGSKTAYALYFVDDTRLKNIETEYEMSKPTVALVVIDSADELIGAYKESEYAEITSSIERLTENWFSGFSGVFRKLASGRFLAVIPEHQLREMMDLKFNVLEQIRAYTYNDLAVGITLSIGVGRADNLNDSEASARQALDMALGRGGDQVAIKNADGSYSFFGGVSGGVEKRTKVRTRIVASAIAEVVKNSSNVIVMGHKFSDLDAMGAAIGMMKCASYFGKSAKIAVSEKTTLAMPLITYMRQNGLGDCFVNAEDAVHLVNDKTLLIVVDTHKADFTENQLLCEKAKTIVVIDHHRKTVNYIANAVIFYHEPHASSTCEMVTELLEYMGKKPIINREEATALLSGITLDTKNFVLRTGSRTFEAAAYLRSRGANTITVKGFFGISMDNQKLRSEVVSKAEIHKNCAISFADINSSEIRIISAQAADELLSVENIDASFVFFKTDDIINISARSMGIINVQIIMEALGGGGHQTMAAAQLIGTTTDKALKMLVDAIDKYYESI